MEKQMRAERDRRAAILTAEAEKQSRTLQSEGIRQSEINQAEGQKQARILACFWPSAWLISDRRMPSDCRVGDCFSASAVRVPRPRAPSARPRLPLTSPSAPP